MEILARKVEKLWLYSLPADPKSIAINELQDKARLAFCKQEAALRQIKYLHLSVKLKFMGFDKLQPFFFSPTAGYLAFSAFLGCA